MQIGTHVSNPTYGKILSIPGLTIMLLWIMIPFVIIFVLSFLRYDVVSPVAFVGLANYVEVLTDPDFPPILWRTFVFSFGSTGLTLFISILVAACLNRIVRGAGFFRSLIIAPWAVPLILSGFIWAWMFHPAFGPIGDILMRLGITSEPLNIFESPAGSMIGVIVADAWRRIPFLTIIALAAFQAISKELYDAAKVDGADSLDVLRRISLPLASRPIVIGTLITLMFTFRSIDVIYSMTPGGGYAKSTYVLGAYLFDHLFWYLDFDSAAAISVIFILLTFVIGAVFIYYTLKKG